MYNHQMPKIKYSSRQLSLEISIRLNKKYQMGFFKNSHNILPKDPDVFYVSNIVGQSSFKFQYRLFVLYESKKKRKGLFRDGSIISEIFKDIVQVSRPGNTNNLKFHQNFIFRKKFTYYFRQHQYFSQNYALLDMRPLPKNLKT